MGKRVPCQATSGRTLSGRIILFATLLVGLDQVSGRTLQVLFQQTQTGEAGGQINRALKSRPDILILGSSRAKHHVDPSVLEKKLGVKAFNAGCNGQDFLYAMMLLDLWSKRNPPPRAILVHVDPNTLSYNAQEIQKTTPFAPFYQQSEVVKGILNLRSSYEWLKQCSACYPYNGKVFPILKNLWERPGAEDRGFEGLNGTMSGRAAVPTPPYTISPEWELKLSLLRRLEDYCRQHNVRLIFFHSPNLCEDEPSLRTWTVQFCRHLEMQGYGEYLDLECQARQYIHGHKELFRDSNHLNIQGAELFSGLLADRLVSVLKSKESHSGMAGDADKSHRASASRKK